MGGARPLGKVASPAYLRESETLARVLQKEMALLLLGPLQEDDNNFICQSHSVSVKENLETIQPSLPTSQVRTKTSPKD